MGNKFVEKHKRKSLLAMLLLLFTGRTKYVLIALLVVLTSLPFVMSGELAGRFFEMPAVASTLRFMGLGSVLSSLNPKYSSEFVKAAIDRAAAESAQTSYWNRFMGAMGSILPCTGSDCGGNTSLAMIKGGADAFGPEAAANKRAKKGDPDKVAGAVSAEDQARGEGADTVDLEGMLNNPAGADAGGLYGNVMGENLADRYASGNGAYGPGPYANRTLISGPGGSTGKGEGIFSNAMTQSGSKVPVPGNPAKVNGKKMGHASGFSWKNVAYKTKGVKMDVKLNSKRPMFQLAETFGMNNAALTTNSPAYQAAYVGSTYDGNDVNLNLIQTGEDTPTMPNTVFAENSISGAGDTGKLANDCSQSQSQEGQKMSDDAAQIDKINNGMGGAPQCYDHGAVDGWNDKVHKMGALCADFNANQTALSVKCQTSNTPMGCDEYSKDTKSGGMLINKCNKPGCSCSWKNPFCCLVWFLFWLMVGLILLAAFAILSPLWAFLAGMAFIIASLMGGGGADGLGGGEGAYKDVKTTVNDEKGKFEEKTSDIK